MITGAEHFEVFQCRNAARMSTCQRLEAEPSSAESMTTPFAFLVFSPAPRSIHILRHFLLLLWCAAPLAAWAQTKPPDTTAPAAVPTLAENLSITPKFGQTQEQLASDSAECQVWAKGQTGFDPTRYGGGVAATDYTASRQLYGRAMGGCLEGHGYYVHFGAPATL